jgi:hypothetical protein
VFDTLSSQTVGWLVSKKPDAQARRDLEQAAESLDDVRERLEQLSR